MFWFFNLIFSISILLIVHIPQENLCRFFSGQFDTRKHCLRGLEHRKKPGFLGIMPHEAASLTQFYHTCKTQMSKNFHISISGDRQSRNENVPGFGGILVFSFAFFMSSNLPILPAALIIVVEKVIHTKG